MRVSVMAAVLVMAAGMPFAASAQIACAEGKTAIGQCVNERLASNARQAAVIFSQPKLSYTAFPVLPSQDAQYRYPSELIPSPLPPVGAGTPAPN